LQRRVDRDQEARRSWLLSPSDRELANRVDDIDSENLAWLRNLIAGRGFPTATDVWRCAEGCGLVVDGADGKPRLEDDSRGRLKHQAVRAGPGPGRGTGLGPEPAKNLTCAGTKPTPRSYPGKCSNLERGESMKDPVSVLGCWRGFSIWGLRGSTRR